MKMIINHVGHSFMNEIAKHQDKLSIDKVLCVFMGKNKHKLPTYTSKVFQYIRAQYHNEGTSPWSDTTYDIVCELMKEKYDFVVENTVGAEVNGMEVQLPEYMGSMNKYKTEKEIQSWMGKYEGPYIVSAKLDGISALWCHGKLYTRGNGSRGRDISHLLPYMNMKKGGTGTESSLDLCVRGELIMTKSIFTQKYQTNYANARNLVCGVVNRNFKEDNISLYMDIMFVAYDVYNKDEMNYSDKFVFLNDNDFHVVEYQSGFSSISTQYGDTLLQKWKTITMDYEIDGIIWTNHQTHNHPNGENPEFAFAYKNNAICVSMTEGVVEKVIWNISKDNYIKPKIQLKEILNCDQSKVEFVTGFNAKYIYENRICAGAKLLIGLSGNVIPHIFQVLKKGSEDTNESTYFGDIQCSYVWSKNKVDLICCDKDLYTSIIKQNVQFFKTFNMKCNLQEKTLLNVYESLGVYHLKDVLSLSLEDWMKVSKTGEKKASSIMSNLYDILHWKKVIENAAYTPYDYFVNLCVGFQTFERGFAVKKIKLFLDYLLLLTKREDIDFHFDSCDIVEYIECKHDFILNHVEHDKPKQVTRDTMVLFLAGLKRFIMRMNELKECQTDFTMVDVKSLLSLVSKGNDQGSSVKMKQYRFVFSGVRDKEIETILIADGHSIEDRVTKDVVMLIVKDEDSLKKASSKIKRANELNVSIYTLDEFKLWYKEYKEMFP